MDEVNGKMSVFASPIDMRASNSHCEIEVAYHPAALTADVRTFMSQAEARCFEFGLAWFDNLTDTVYAGSEDIRFYILRRAGAVVAVVPLRAERSIMGLKLHALGNFYTTQFEPLFAPTCGPRDIAQLLRALGTEWPGLVSLRLAPMDPSAPAYRLMLEGVRACGWRPFEFFTFGNWYESAPGQWIDYLARRDGVLRSTIKRMTRKFDANGGTLELVTESVGLQRGIDAYEQVYANSWKTEEPFPLFMPGLLRTCAQQGSLRLGLAWLGGRPIAAQVWIVSNGRAAIYKLAYDEGFKQYAPGTLLTAKLMQHALDMDQVHEVDYLVGDDPYKKTWMSDRRERWGIIAYNPRSIKGAVALLRESVSRALKGARTRFERIRRSLI